jgi:hypothetical protein
MSFSQTDRNNCFNQKTGSASSGSSTAIAGQLISTLIAGDPGGAGSGTLTAGATTAASSSFVNGIGYTNSAVINKSANYMTLHILLKWVNALDSSQLPVVNPAISLSLYSSTAPSKGGNMVNYLFDFTNPTKVGAAYWASSVIMIPLDKTKTGTYLNMGVCTLQTSADTGTNSSTVTCYGAYISQYT